MSRPARVTGRIYLHRLGCPKLDVDHDWLAAGLRERGGRLVGAPEEADTVIVSTCAFLGDARLEAREAIEAAVDWKRDAPGRRVFVTGCLPAADGEAAAGLPPGVDGVFTPARWGDLLARFGEEERGGVSPDAPSSAPAPAGQVPAGLTERLASRRGVPDGAYAYLKIAEGCDRRCAYCAIPRIRGRYRSRRPEDILAEAGRLLDGGARELIVVAQEVNSYGRDLPSRADIESLLPALGERVAEAGGWLRVLYTHPPLYSERFLEALVNTPALVPYLDFPIEHADDKVLKAMGRGTTWAEMARWIDRLREHIEELALRTSVIVGHPGEGAREFATLLARLDEVKFERLGVFRFSPESGTSAAGRPAAEQEEAIRREQDVIALSLEHAEAWYAGRVGRRVRMLVEGSDDQGRALGRTVWDAPEVDGEAAATIPARPGSFLAGRVIAAEPHRFTIAPDPTQETPR